MVNEQSVYCMAPVGEQTTHKTGNLIRNTRCAFLNKSAEAMKYVSEKADQASKTLQQMNDQAAVSSEELPFDERSQYCTEVLGLCSLLLIMSIFRSSSKPSDQSRRHPQSKLI
ncbi:hypothetical protein M3Y97_01089300 [Aphelenchoides bicaudatus]|nr:hypothetical protein M3Y97_01089300 [Aphelenchoides bicaudatus]